jgi:hypothetical protein
MALGAAKTDESRGEVTWAVGAACEAGTALDQLKP